MSHIESHDVGSFDDRIGDRPPAVSASTVARRQICLNQPVTGSAIFLEAPGGISQVNENANIFGELDGPGNQLHHRRAGPAAQATQKKTLQSLGSVSENGFQRLWHDID